MAVKQIHDVGWDADPSVVWHSFGALDRHATTDVCVIGLGGSGLAAVGDAITRGLSVIGIDAGRVAAGAAGRNGGFLLGGPVQAVHVAAEQWGAELAVDLYRQTITEIDHLETLLGDDVIRRVGSLRIAGLPGVGPDGPSDTETGSDPDAERADCDAQFNFMRAHDLPVQRYSGPLGSGLYFPRDAAMNPVRRAMGLAGLYGAAARMYENTPAIAISSRAVRTPGGKISAGIVIVAIDGRLETVLPQLAGRVRTARLQMAATAPARIGTVPCPLYANWGFDYLQQDDTGRIYAGGGRDRYLGQEWTDQSEPSRPVQDWIDLLINRVAGPIAPRVTHRWAASVGYTPDLRPVVAEVDDRVVACGGYSGTGNLIGPIAARTAIALALDGTAPPPYFAS
ncbi:MAG: FAD-binding oxidoreductase [Microbacteriaceae bacterium]